MKKLLLMCLVIGVSGCASGGGVTKHMEYDKSPCACVDDSIIFNGREYQKKEVV